MSSIKPNVSCENYHSCTSRESRRQRECKTVIIWQKKSFSSGSTNLLVRGLFNNSKANRQDFMQFVKAKRNLNFFPRISFKVLKLHSCNSYEKFNVNVACSFVNFMFNALQYKNMFLRSRFEEFQDFLLLLESVEDLKLVRKTINH